MLDDHPSTFRTFLNKTFHIAKGLVFGVLGLNHNYIVYFCIGGGSRVEQTDQVSPLEEHCELWLPDCQQRLCGGY